jgi:hypothetical protein
MKRCNVSGSSVKRRFRTCKRHVSTFKRVKTSRFWRFRSSVPTVKLGPVQFGPIRRLAQVAASSRSSLPVRLRALQAPPGRPCTSIGPPVQPPGRPFASSLPLPSCAVLCPPVHLAWPDAVRLAPALSPPAADVVCCSATASLCPADVCCSAAASVCPAVVVCSRCLLFLCIQLSTPAPTDCYSTLCSTEIMIY